MPAPPLMPHPPTCVTLMRLMPRRDGLMLSLSCSRVPMLALDCSPSVAGRVGRAAPGTPQVCRRPGLRLARPRGARHADCTRAVLSAARSLLGARAPYPRPALATVSPCAAAASPAVEAAVAGDSASGDDSRLHRLERGSGGSYLYQLLCWLLLVARASSACRAHHAPRSLIAVRLGLVSPRAVARRARPQQRIGRSPQDAGLHDGFRARPALEGDVEAHRRTVQPARASDEAHRYGSRFIGNVERCEDGFGRVGLGFWLAV